MNNKTEITRTAARRAKNGWVLSIDTFRFGSWLVGFAFETGLTKAEAKARAEVMIGK